MLDRRYTDVGKLADAIIRELRGDIVLGLPLGLGKANHIANAFYDRAAADRTIRLQIFTALTLEKPPYRSELERRFLEPVIERLFGGYPELAYARASRNGTLPSNIEVHEFFLLAGRWLGARQAQQNYVSVNYTHASRLLIDRGVNVVAQLVAKRGRGDAERFSLSCNTDVTLDVLKARANGNARFLLLGQVNAELPYMTGSADLPDSEFAAVLDSEQYQFPLFAPPKEPLSLPEYASGIHIARVLPDGGTLQIGIGGEGDAAIHALILRHKENDAFQEAVARLGAGRELSGGNCIAPFEKGLYAATEMLVDGLLPLRRAGVLVREVEGAVAHAAFFVGPKDFYRALREMPDAEREKFQMRAVSFTNQLYGDEAVKLAARVNARFINSTMMATLLGEGVSDTLESGQVVSGVGGQHNFVEQAFALPGARSILALKATRQSGRTLSSNIRWSAGRITIPRHLRDIFITEYGIADLRGKSDSECIAAMLAIADSRFQGELLHQAKATGKIDREYEIPTDFLENTPDRIERSLLPLRQRGLLPLFPLGTDLTSVEQQLVPALAALREASASLGALLGLLVDGIRSGNIHDDALERLALLQPRNLREQICRWSVNGALGRVRS